MNIQFKKGALELCVLSLLQNIDRYGYELVQAVSENITISEGTIYPLLRRLTLDGLAETYLRESNEGPPRKYYRLTPKGKESQQLLETQWYEFSSGVNRLLEGGRAHG